MTENFRAHVFVLIATIIISFSFIISNKLSGLINPISITLLRFIFAFSVLLPFILAIKKYRRKIKQSFLRGLKISLFYSLYFILLFEALELTKALNTSTLFTLVPLVTAILASFIFGDKLNLKKLIAYIIGMIGTVIVIFAGSLETISKLVFNNGDIIFLLAVLCMSFYSISVKFFHKKDDEILVLTLMTLFGGIIWMSLALIFFDIPLEWTKIEGQNFLYIVYLSIPSTLFTVYLYQKATVIIGPNKVMAYIYLNPSFVAFMMFIYENEKINLNIFIGILISVFATIFLLKQKV